MPKRNPPTLRTIYGIGQWFLTMVLTSPLILYVRTTKRTVTVQYGSGGVTVRELYQGNSFVIRFDYKDDPRGGHSADQWFSIGGRRPLLPPIPYRIFVVPLGSIEVGFWRSTPR